MPKKQTSKKKTRAKKTATPSEIAKAQQDKHTAAGVDIGHGEHVDNVGPVTSADDVQAAAMAAKGVLMVDTQQLTASEIATAEAKDAGLKIFKATSKPPADRDAMYFAAVDEADAKDELFITCGKAANGVFDLFEIAEVDALPEGELFMNDVIAKRDEVQGKEKGLSLELNVDDSTHSGEPYPKD